MAVKIPARTHTHPVINMRQHMLSEQDSKKLALWLRFPEQRTVCGSAVRAAAASARTAFRQVGEPRQPRLRPDLLQHGVERRAAALGQPAAH